MKARKEIERLRSEALERKGEDSGSLTKEDEEQAMQELRDMDMEYPVHKRSLSWGYGGWS